MCYTADIQKKVVKNVLGFFNYTTWLTYLGASCGVLGIWSAMDGREMLAIIFLAAAGFFDLFDGKVASTKKDRTEEMKRFGIQIDSLSDVICFGVLPAAILICMAKSLHYTVGYFLPVACLYLLAALIRLAYFNVAEENRQKKETGARKTYSGIPVTTTAVVLPFFYAVAQLIGAVFDINAPTLEKWYFLFFLAELIFFAFGFLFKGFRIKKFHGKKMLIPVVIGGIAVVAMITLFLIRS